MDLTSILRVIGPAVLVGGFAVAADRDWRTREVSDRLWQLLAMVGALVGAVLLYPDGALALASWVLVCAFVAEHLFPWDEPIEKVNARLPGAIEIVAYALVAIGLTWVGVRYGIGPSGLPVPVLAVFLTVLFARGLFEAGLLYGGADAKAMIAAGILVPVLPYSLIAVPHGANAILPVYPFSLTLLMNAALVATVVPLAIAVRNVRRGEFGFPRGFTGFTIPVRELSERFVWLKDPSFARGSEAMDAVETSEEDRQLRVRQKAELEARGVERVWVTPQVPFLVLFFLGALLSIVAGNLLFDLISLA